MVTRRVRVWYYREADGWSFEVWDRDTDRYIGGGWSRGTRRDARDDFNDQCRARGWIL